VRRTVIEGLVAQRESQMRHYRSIGGVLPGVEFHDPGAVGFGLPRAGHDIAFHRGCRNRQAQLAPEPSMADRMPFLPGRALGHADSVILV